MPATKKPRKLPTMLRAIGACADAVNWSRDYATLQEAWNACPRADWMLWLLGTTNTHQQECIRLALSFADRAVRVGAVAALRSAASAADMPPEHAKALRDHAAALESLGKINTSAAAGAASAAAWAASDAAWAASAAAGAASDAAWAASAAAWAASAAAGAASDAENANAVRAAIPDTATILAAITHA